MSKKEFLSRHALIIKRLKRCQATFDEITDYLAFESELQEYRFTVSKRTFQRDLDDIRTLYNIDIRYDFSRKVYYIDNQEFQEVQERMLEAFNVFNALNLTDRLSEYIHFEKRRPQGTEHLYGLLHAIRNRLQISISYHKYWEEEPTVRLIEPYALKEFRNRWYVVGRDRKDGRIKTFALDRINDFDCTRNRYELPERFDVNAYYRNCFGIISPNYPEPGEVVLAFTQAQGKYIKSMPLHETQEILNDTEAELRIRLTLYITHDFLMEILSYGAEVKVLAPKSFAKEVKAEYRKALELY